MNEQKSLEDLAKRANLMLHPSDYRHITLQRDIKAHAERFGKTEDQVWDEIESSTKPSKV